MVKIKKIIALFIIALSIKSTFAQTQTDEQISIVQASESIEKKLSDSLERLSVLRQKSAEELLPLNKQLDQLETQLIDLRSDYMQTSHLLDSRTLDLNNLRNEIKSRKEESVYLSNLLSEYARNFESRLHIAEIQLYQDVIEDAKLASENNDIDKSEVYRKQVKLIETSLDRIDDAVGGRYFKGKAVDKKGVLKEGEFAMIGPVAMFLSDDGENIGTVEQRLGSLEPAVVGFANPEDAQAAKMFVKSTGRYFPFDPTLGNAHVVESTNQTLWEHIQKGGPVMIPILAMASLATLVAIYKWLTITFVKKPNHKNLSSMLDSIASCNYQKAFSKAKSIGGPFGKMLTNALEHINEPPELIEEVMYETVLETKLKLQRLLPFVAICAASAPLLGLLGTVTGIINTFKLITVFGSGDVKTLSGGISEALITTEFGLIVAIPSLLLHAFLSRKAQSVVDEMEKAAVCVVNQVSKTSFRNNNQTDGVSVDA